MLTLLALAALAQPQPAAAIVERPPSGPLNREPLRQVSLAKLPIGAFKPAGWLGRCLELQRDGLTGHLGEISVWLTKTDNAWLRTDGKGQYGWEEVPYWLRGYARLAFALEDPRMLAESKVWIEGVLNSQRDDGDFGPVVLKNNRRDLWAQMLMLQVLQSFHEYAHDPRVVPFMTRYFKWQLTVPDADFLKDYWENSRGGDNLASVYWLYNITGDAFLLELASKIDRNTADWRQADNLPNWHVVNIAECFRAPATFFLQSHKQSDLDASYRSFRIPRDRFGQVPGGMFGADENARPGHTDPHQGAETCSFVEQLWSNLHMTAITADPLWAANSEDVAFNSLPAAFTPDYRALRYLTCPNQAVSDAKNHAPGIANEGPFFLMNPFSSRCCQHNHSSAWINYTEHAFFSTADSGLAAVLYAPGRLRTTINNQPVDLACDTRYPFEDSITFTIKQAPADLPLYFRIPSWTDNPTLALNGAVIRPTELARPKTPAYFRLRNTLKPGDKITLRFPMHLALRTWDKNKNAVSVDYGPLTFALQIAEKYTPVPSDKTAIGDSGWQPGADPSKWPSHEILPASPWNYALQLDPANPAASLTISRRPWPASNEPFTNDNAPIRLHAKGKLLPGWTLDQHGLAGALPQSPVTSSEPLADLTLVPMGGARLRISSFPVLQ